MSQVRLSCSGDGEDDGWHWMSVDDKFKVYKYE